MAKQSMTKPSVALAPWMPMSNMFHTSIFWSISTIRFPWCKYSGSNFGTAKSTKFLLPNYPLTLPGPQGFTGTVPLQSKSYYFWFINQQRSRPALLEQLWYSRPRGIYWSGSMIAVAKATGMLWKVACLGERQLRCQDKLHKSNVPCISYG